MSDAIPDWDKPSGPQENIPDWDKSPAPQEKTDFGGAVKAGAKQTYEASGKVAAAGTGGELGMALGGMTGPLAPIASPVLGLVGAGAGYFGQDYLTPKIERMLPKWTGFSQQQREEERTAHPTATGVADYGVDAISAIPLGMGLYQGTKAAIAKGPTIANMIGKIAKPSTISELGGKIHTKITDALEALTKARKPQADKLFDAYLSKAKPYEDEILSYYQKSLKDYYAKNVAGRSLSNEEKSAVEEAFKRTAGFSPQLGSKEGEKIAPGIKSLEKERRILNDIADGMDVKGAEGISARAARDMSDILTKTIKKYVPKEFDAAMEGYKTLSEPINRFSTALGSKITKAAGEYLPDMPKTDPAQVPGAFFKTKRGAQELKALSGDAKFAEQAAKEHVANELSGAKSSEDIERFLQNKNNKDWLTEFPKLRSQLEDAAKTLKKTERVRTVAKGAVNYVGKPLAAGLGIGGGYEAGRKIFGGF